MDALPTVLFRLVDSMDINSLVYDFAYSFVSVIMACELVKSTVCKRSSSIPQACLISYNLHEGVVGVFPQSGRVRVTNQGSGQFQNVSALSAVSLIRPLPIW